MKDFLRDCKYKSEITEAIAYENKLSYFIQTHLNTDIYTNTTDTISGVWNSLNPFINWIRSWMREDNFHSYLKFLRFPLPTNSLIQDDVIPELKKVFDSTNAYFDYEFSSNSVKLSGLKLINKYKNYYKETIFKELINNHNSIVITDYKDKGNPYRFIINISSVKAIEPTKDGSINRIVFVGTNNEGKERWFYYTREFYAVYEKLSDSETGEEFREEIKNFHEIGECPADFISTEPLNSSSFVVRKHLFSNQLEKFENYVNYYTLQKMCLPHGAMPIITHYKKKNAPCNKSFENGTKCVEGYISSVNGILNNKDNLIPCPACNPKTIIQAGTVIGMPVPKFGQDGERPFDMNANFVKFHYIPVDILEWWNKFVKEKESEIKYQLVGKGLEDSNGQAKNKDQIARGNQTLENTLMDLSNKISILRTSLDTKSLRIAFGKSFHSCSIDMGSDFYLETEFELRDSLAKAIDPIDKKNLISRINYSIYKNNPEQLERNNILYKLLPYSTLTDDQFITMQGVDPKLRELRLNYQYYIDALEAEYGELNVMFNEVFGENMPMIKKLQMANALLFKYINIIDYESVSVKVDTGEGIPV